MVTSSLAVSRAHGALVCACASWWWEKDKNLEKYVHALVPSIVSVLLRNTRSRHCVKKSALNMTS